MGRLHGLLASAGCKPNIARAEGLSPPLARRQTRRQRATQRIQTSPQPIIARRALAAAAA